MGELKDCQIKFRLSGEMKRKIEELAAKLDVSASWVIREAVKVYIQKES